MILLLNWPPQPHFLTPYEFGNQDYYSAPTVPAWGLCSSLSATCSFELGRCSHSRLGQWRHSVLVIPPNIKGTVSSPSAGLQMTETAWAHHSQLIRLPLGKEVLRLPPQSCNFLLLNHLCLCLDGSTCLVVGGSISEIISGFYISLVVYRPLP